MATVTPRRPWNRNEAQSRVRHPLQTLRGTIRRYVALEGLAVGVIYLACCFWLGVTLDWGLFALFRFDWIKEIDRASGNLEASSWLRLGLLAIAVGGLIAVVTMKVLRRLFTEFSDRALALVLERRFPRELGDRLITAVEMADPELSKKYGFSQEMLDKTIAEAADRVERLPVEQVFNWVRLRWRLIWTGIMVVGVYLVAGLVSCIVAAATGGNPSPVAYFWEFNHVAGTWFDRNILVQDRRYWLGNEYLELIRFPDARKREEDGLAELRVARDENRPDIWIRAVQWVVADRGPDAPEGWRALRWSDLPEYLDSALLAKVDIPAAWGGWVIDMDDLDPSVPAGVIPPEWGWHGKTAGHIRADLKRPAVKTALTTGRGAEVKALAAVEKLLDWRTWTVDQLERQLRGRDRAEVQEALKAGHKAAYQALQARDTGVLWQLAELADSPRMRGTLRKLQAPELVTVHRRGKLSKSSSPASKQSGNKYSFSLNELKESVTFTVAGDEYTTPARAITLVPPPAVNRLTIDKLEPAYIHYRLLGEDAGKLKGLRQTFRDVPMSTTGTKSVIPVLFGTDVTVTAVVDRRLKGGVRISEPVKRDEPGSLTPPVKVELLPGGKSFAARFPAVTRTIEFDFEYRDEDNVKGRRHIVLKPNDDKAPTLVGVNLSVVLRPDYDPETSKAPPGKSGDRLLITPNARLPFKGIVADDHGLAKLEFQYKFVEVAFQKLGDANDPTKKSEGFVLEGNPLTRRAGMVISTFQFAPGMPGFEWFAPAYVGGLSHLATADLKRPGPRLEPESGAIEMEFAQRRLTQRIPDDVTLEELQRLLQIQPRNRPLAIELLKLKGQTEQQNFLKRLQDLNQHEAVLTDTLNFLELDDAQRIPLLAKIGPDPAAVVRGILAEAAKDREKADRALALLTRAPERTLVREHQLDSEGRIRFDEETKRWRFENGNGFDIKTYLPKLKAPTGETQRHYELHVFVSATDNNVETGPTKGPTRGPFVFLVVSENELLAEISKQERKLYNLLKEAVDNLDGRKTTLEADLLRLDSVQFADLEGQKLKETTTYLGALAVRSEQARKAIREAGDMARAVLERYNGIIAEMLVNRVEGDKLGKVENQIAGPLYDMTHKTNGDFVFVDRVASKLYHGVDEDAGRLRKADQARKVDAPLLQSLETNRPIIKEDGKATVDNMVRLSRQLHTVLEAMADAGREAEIIRILVQIEAERREHHRQIEIYHKKLIEELFGGLDGK